MGSCGAGGEELEKMSKGEMLAMLKFGADRIFANEEGEAPTDQELAAIIDRSITLGQSGAAATTSPVSVRLTVPLIDQGLACPLAEPTHEDVPWHRSSQFMLSSLDAIAWQLIPFLAAVSLSSKSTSH